MANAVVSRDTKRPKSKPTSGSSLSRAMATPRGPRAPKREGSARAPRLFSQSVSLASYPRKSARGCTQLRHTDRRGVPRTVGALPRRATSAPMSTIARAVLAAPAGRLATRVGTRMTGSARARDDDHPARYHRPLRARHLQHLRARAPSRARTLQCSLAPPSPSPTRPSSGVVRRRASSIAANATANPASRQFPSTDVPSDAFYDAVVVVAGGMTDSGGLPRGSSRAWTTP